MFISAYFCKFLHNAAHCCTFPHNSAYFCTFLHISAYFCTFLHSSAHPGGSRPCRLRGGFSHNPGTPQPGVEGRSADSPTPPARTSGREPAVPETAILHIPAYGPPNKAEAVVQRSSAEAGSLSASSSASSSSGLAQQCSSLAQKC